MSPIELSWTAKEVEIEIGYIMYIKQMQISKRLMVAKAIFYFQNSCSKETHLL